MGRKGIERYIGEEFKTKRGNTLKITGITNLGKKGNKLILECNVCSQDTELYPEGSIVSTYSALKNGKVPCGCSVSSIRTEEQNKILATRAAESKGLIFLGWDGPYKKKKTFLRLYNPELQYCWNTTVLAYFIATDHKCCPESRRLGNRNNNPEFLDKAKKAYPEGTVFERCDKGTLDKTGRDMYWKVTCPVCSEDEYAKNGISDGTFRVNGGALREGQVSCRCAGDRYHRTRPEYLYYANKVAKTTGYHIDLSKYKEVDSKTVVEYYCPEGHLCSTRLGIFLHKPTCGTCNDGGFDPNKPAHFYIVRWYGYCESFIKFGITNREVIDRITEQDRASAHLDYEILHTFHHESGKVVFDCESFLKRNMTTGVCSKEWLPDGYTETVVDSQENIDYIISKIKQYSLKEGGL